MGGGVEIKELHTDAHSIYIQFNHRNHFTFGIVALQEFLFPRFSKDP